MAGLIEDKGELLISRRALLKSAAALAGLGVAGGLLQACAPAAAPSPTAAPAAGATSAPVAEPTKAPAASAGRTYTFWHWWVQQNNQTFFKYVTDKFAEKYPGSSVELFAPGADYGPKLKAGAAGGQAPDIAAMDGTGGFSWDTWKSGVCLELTPYYDAEWQKVTDLWEKVPTGWKYYQGRLYGAVWSINTMCIWWWKDSLADLGGGIPQTMDELFALVPKAKSKGLSVLSAGFGPMAPFNAIDYYLALEMLYDPTQKKLWDAAISGEGSWLGVPELKQAMDTWDRMFKEKVFNPQTLEEDFLRGNVTGATRFRDRQVLGYYIAGPWMIGYDWKDPEKDLKQIGLSTFPKVTPSNPWTNPGSHDMCFSIFTCNENQKSKEYQATMLDLLKMGNSADAQKKMFSVGLEPAWSGALDQPVDTPQKQLVKDHIDLLMKVKGENIGERGLYNAQMSMVMTEQLTAVAANRTTADKALETLEAARKRYLVSS